jgi:hypothetical protein
MGEATLEALPTLRSQRGWVRQWPSKLHADKGDEDAKCRQACSQRGNTPRRWVVERTLAWVEPLPAVEGVL